jgi:hypothetical protein
MLALYIRGILGYLGWSLFSEVQHGLWQVMMMSHPRLLHGWLTMRAPCLGLILAALSRHMFVQLGTDSCRSVLSRRWAPFHKQQKW